MLAHQYGTTNILSSAVNNPLILGSPTALSHPLVQDGAQVTLTELCQTHRFELCGSIYTGIFFNRHILQYCMIYRDVTQSCPTLCDPMDCSLPGSSVHGIFQSIVLEWIAISFSRRIFPTQGLNPRLPHCRQTLYRLSHQGSPVVQKIVFQECGTTNGGDNL